MKLFLTIAFLACCAAASFAQRVPSSCDAPDSVKKLYLADAAGLAYDYQITLHPSYIDSTSIPQSLQDTFLRALLAVYNAVQLPDAYHVSLEIRIHDHCGPSFDKIRIEHVDTAVDWEKKLFLRQIPTSNVSIDSLLQIFGITVDTVIDVGIGLPEVILRTRIYYNTPVIIERWNQLVGSNNAYPENCFGDGDFIKQRFVDSIIHLTYSIGWGDCPAGCISRDYWYFSVYPDCSVSFDGAEGVSVTDNEDSINELTLYPNPASHIITIKSQPRNIIEILDLQGKVLETSFSKEEKTEIDISSLTKGIYFVRVTNKRGNYIGAKFIKEKF